MTAERRSPMSAIQSFSILRQVDGSCRSTPTASCRPSILQDYAESFIQSIQQECTDHFIVCGKRHFDYLVKEYVDHYHTERPQQGLGNVPLRMHTAPLWRSKPS